MANSFTYQEETYHTGDTIGLHLTVSEGDKSRTQIFEGIVIAIKGEGAGKSVTVRKIGAGAIGVERIVPLGSPKLTKITRKSKGDVRRSKLYYLRDRIGKKATKVKTKVEEVKKAPAKKAAPKKAEAKKAAKPTAKKTAKSSPKKATKPTAKKASK